MASAPESAPLDGRLDALLLGVLFARARSALLVFDEELRLLRANTSARQLPGVPAEGEEDGTAGGGARPYARDVGAVADGAGLERLLRQAVTSGTPVRDVEMPGGDDGDRVLSVSAYPLATGDGAPAGALAQIRDVTDRRRSRSRLELLRAAEARMGALLDVGRVARELAAVVVPALADVVVVDVVDAVWRGEQQSPAPGAEELTLRRAAVAPAVDREEHGTGTLVRYPFPSPQTGSLTDLRPRLIQDPPRPAHAEGAVRDRERPADDTAAEPAGETAAAAGGAAGDAPAGERGSGEPVPASAPPGPETAPGAGPADEDRACPAANAHADLPEGADDAHSLMLVPLTARGTLLGLLSLYRSARPARFDDTDLRLASEVAELAAVSIDNARRQTRAHTTASALQRSLLPAHLPESNAVEAGLAYVPGTFPGTRGAGGDWFDVIALSGARVALVVGDVTGSGLHAAATMGRLRSAIGTMAALDLSPDELLAHLDALVTRLVEDPPDPFADPGPDRAPPAATCAYAVHDPIAMRVTLALAGHPPPVVVRPDGGTEIADEVVGPPLGRGTCTFRSADLDLPEGTLLGLYTNGLLSCRRDRADEGLDRLRRTLADPARPVQDLCDAAVRELLPARPHDDAVLLAARLRALPSDQVVSMLLPMDTSAVSDARDVVRNRLTDWGLAELTLPTELIVSELLANAVRHAPGPIRLKLIRQSVLTCEVADTSHRAPHLRHATSSDEGGRGLYLVAQLADRWGVRYSPQGKVVWTEQKLPEA